MAVEGGVLSGDRILGLRLCLGLGVLEFYKGWVSSCPCLGYCLVLLVLTLAMLRYCEDDLDMVYSKRCEECNL